MYDDLLGKKKKKEKGIVIIEDCDWDDKNKKVIVKKRTKHEIDIEVDENGVVTWNNIPTGSTKLNSISR